MRASRGAKELESEDFTLTIALIKSMEQKILQMELCSLINFLVMLSLSMSLAMIVGMHGAAIAPIAAEHSFQKYNHPYLVPLYVQPRYLPYPMSLSRHHRKNISFLFGLLSGALAAVLLGAVIVQSMKSKQGWGKCVLHALIHTFARNCFQVLVLQAGAWVVFSRVRGHFGGLACVPATSKRWAAVDLQKPES